jgi:hypothetical protein
VNVKDPYVLELLDILGQTKSVDAFLVTVALLAEVKPEARSAIPVVIRNAERLGIYGRYALEKDSASGDLARQLAEQLKQMATSSETGKVTARPGESINLPSGHYLDYGRLPMNIPDASPSPSAPERKKEQSRKDNFRTPPDLPPIDRAFSNLLNPQRPDDATVLRALRQKKRGKPFLCEESRSDIKIVSELLVNKIEPPRFFPLVGPAHRQRSHWKCTVSYTQTIESSYPFPYRTSRPRCEVVYLDKDHLYPCSMIELPQGIDRDLLNN